MRVGHRPGADPRLDESEGRHAYLVMAGLVSAIYARLIGSPPLRLCVDGRDRPGHDGHFLARRSRRTNRLPDELRVRSPGRRLLRRCAPRNDRVGWVFHSR